MVIEVKGAKYKVRVKQIDPNASGLCFRDKKEIHISDEADKSEFFPILAHELGHAYLEETKLTYMLDPAIEEMICLMLEDYAKTILKLSGKKWGK